MTDNNSLSRRRFLQATGGAAAATAIAGCSKQQQPGTETGTPSGETTEPPAGTETPTETATPAEVGKNTLSLINSTISTFDPIAATDTASGTVIQQVFDALMNYPNGETTTKKLLATSYTVSDDFKTYTFKIHDDATFHNNKDVTASDFVYSFERLAASKHSHRAYFILSSLGVTHETTSDGKYKPGTLGLTAVDDKTLEIELKSPFHSTLPMLAYTSFAAVPEGIVGDVKGYDGRMEYNEFATSNPIGAGAFRFKSWEEGTSADVTAYKNYYGKKPNVNGVHWQIIEKSQPAYNYGQNKNADIIPIPSSQYSRDKISIDRTDSKGRKFGSYGPMRNGMTANYMSAPQLLTYYVGFNMAAVPKPVRQAFAYAMNQQTLVQEVFKGRGQPAYHLTPPPIYPKGNYTPHAKNNYPYGYNKTMLDKARQVMEEAGYGPNNKYEVQWTQYQSSTWLEMAKILRDKLASAHINMQIEQAQFSTMLKRGRNGNLEAYTLGWIADWPAPDNFLQLLNPPQTDTSKDAPISYLNWSSETGSAAQEATDAYKKVQNNPAPTDKAQKARNEAYVTIEEANWEDVGFLNVYHAIGERFWYDWLEIPPYGGMGPSRQMYNNAKLGERK